MQNVRFLIDLNEATLGWGRFFRTPIFGAMAGDMLPFVLLGIGCILLCSAHLCGGFYMGYRLGQSRSVGGEADAIPSYLPNVVELISRSQELHLQLGAYVQELPEKILLASARLIESAEAVRSKIPEESLARLPQLRPAATATESGPPASVPRAALPVSRNGDRPAGPNSETTRLVERSSPGDGAAERTPASYINPDDPHLGMSDVMHLLVKSNRSQEVQSPAADVRYPYTAAQFVAFCSAGLPSAEHFEQVRCLDISAGGISFLLNRRPETETLVISLGQAPRLTFVRAKVMNHRYMLANGHEGYRIGCLFTKRLDGEYQWDTELARIVAACPPQPIADQRLSEMTA